MGVEGTEEGTVHGRRTSLTHCLLGFQTVLLELGLVESVRTVPSDVDSLLFEASSCFFRDVHRSNRVVHGPPLGR